MVNTRAFALREAVASAAASGILLAVLAGMGPGRDIVHGPTRGLSKLGWLGTAAGLYRNDNQNFLPLTLTYTPRGSSRQTNNSLVGWCAWSAAGKNNHPFWFNASGGGFDVEAADRPFNSYAQPDVTFTAPPPPARLPMNDARRLNDQAPALRDDLDSWSYERSWPQRNLTVSTYDDVGTSYLWNAIWWDQPGLPTGFEQRMAAGAQRFASGQGVTPWKFAWLSDPHLSVAALGDTNPKRRLPNWYGHQGKSVMLFVDGHAAYLETLPGRRFTTKWTTVFSDLPGGGG
ncbi:MAG: hypothetical protein JNM07_08120 [Phycisphaerae bacterium]|nr:hypothetical protein [Phycisphaerae bacterium]